MKKKYVIYLIIIMSIIFFSRHQTIKNKKEKLEEIILNVDDVKDIGEKYIVVEKNGKYGIADTSGNLVMNFNYDYIRKLSSRNYFLKDSNNQKIYDIESKKEFLIDGINYIGNDLYKISKNNKYGVIDKHLNVKVEVINDEISSNGKQILVINEREKYLLDRDLNKKILKDEYESIQLGIGNYLYFKVNGRYGVIDSSEVLKVFPKYEEVLNLNDKNILIGSAKGDNYFINLDKNIEKKLDYENYSMESANRIMVSKDNKIGYINNVGKEVIPLEYDGGFAFKDKKDFIQLKKGEFWYLLDLETLKAKKLSFDDIGEYVEGYMVVEKKKNMVM